VVRELRIAFEDLSLDTEPGLNGPFHITDAYETAWQAPWWEYRVVIVSDDDQGVDFQLVESSRQMRKAFPDG
jgi:hypothetical protein